MSVKKHKYEMESPDTGFKLVIPFFLAMAVLTVVSFIIPLRPTESSMEKRDLAEFPEFSLTALADGSYFDDITLWFSDTFPGREDWITLSSNISSLHGYSEIAIEGELTLGEDFMADLDVMQEEITEPVQPEDSPEETVSVAEEEPDEETVPEETEAEEWGGVNAAENLIARTAVIQIGDTAFNYLGFSSANSDNYIKYLNAFAAAMEGTGVNVVSAPCPTAIGILVEPEYLDMLNAARQDDMLEYLHSGMTDNIVKVDTFSAMIAHNSEYIYFRTDHHWTALGAYYSYRAICEALGYIPAELDDFEEWDLGEFEGSIYWKVKYPKKLKLDNVIAYIPQGDIECSNSKDGYTFYETELLRDTTTANANNRYLTFISGGTTITKVVNNSLPDAPNCVLVIDSFGNCMVPFLTQNYNTIYAIDYRKYTRMNLQRFCEQFDIDDVIIMPYITATQSSQVPDLFKPLYGV